MLKQALIGIAATALVVATASEIRFPPRPKILYNPSASAPIGYYAIGQKERFNVGDRVAAYGPDWARALADERGYLPFDYPLIKTIIASEGMEVCRKDGKVSAPNYPDIPVAARDGSGRDLPSWQGCIVLQKDEYFIVSHGTEAGRHSGFDSRYFGPVPGEAILGLAEYLGHPGSSPSGQNRGGTGK